MPMRHGDVEHVDFRCWVRPFLAAGSVFAIGIGNHATLLFFFSGRHVSFLSSAFRLGTFPCFPDLIWQVVVETSGYGSRVAVSGRGTLGLGVVQAVVTGLSKDAVL